jgi:uncharacterized protein (DUF433 family)
MTPTAFNYIGRGLYSLPEAERLTGVPRRSIRRWTTGYQWNSRGELRYSPPVVGAELPSIFGAPAIDFADLIEVRFLNAFLDKGVGWKTIRIASERAKEVLRSAHPFSHRRFSTDGHAILAELAREEEDPVLLDLVRDQYELNRMIEHFLFGEIDFGDADIPKRWYPLGLNRQVVIDPGRALGASIVDRGSIPTAVLYASVQAEDSEELVADMYEVSTTAVADAVEYEASRPSS